MSKKFIFIVILILISNYIFAQVTPLWLRYPSISPDGKIIVFSYQGNIFKVPAEGGEATPLTINSSYEYKPIWSLDSKNIAFASDRNGNFDIYIISINGGKSKRLTFHSSREVPNSFTPDGKNILFSATIMDISTNILFPKYNYTELYSVPVIGGRTKQILSTPAQLAIYDKIQENIIYQDVKGVEDYWRKHHTSSVTRDIWTYSIKTQKHTKLTTFEGEDRNPVFSNDEKEIYFLREQINSSFNVCKFSLSEPNNVTQISKHEKHPVRFLSISTDNTICYGYDGEIYTKKIDENSFKVPITINIESTFKEPDYQTFSSKATEMNVSPDGKEIVFVVRGDVFVTSAEYSTTKQITNTTQQERNVSFSPDGRSILYASERNGSWNIYQTSLTREEEKDFVSSTILKEIPIIETSANEFQAEYSFDGKEIAYLHNRTTLKVINIESKESRTILDGKHNYSYTDGDMNYNWSPDGKWFLVQYSPNHVFLDDIALVDAQGNQKITNLTHSGYNDKSPKWMLSGNMLIWFSNRNGLKNYGMSSPQWDIYGMFLNNNSYDKFKLSKEEYEKIEKEDSKDKKDEEEDEEEDEKVEMPEIELDGIDDRIERLTINSCRISDAILSKDGEKLFYLAKFEKGYDLWVHEFKENTTKLVLKLSGYGKSLTIDKEGKNLFLLSSGKIIKISTKDYKKTNISFKAEMKINKHAEREYIFNHIWNLIKVKHLDKNLHNTDWDFYYTEYKKFLPYINNNYDFAEMLSEMLGELNSSHTGSGYRYRQTNRDKTATFAAFYDQNYTENGLKIIEIIDKSPLLKADSKIKVGTIIEKINENIIKKNQDYYQFLNHKAGKNTLLTLYNPETEERWTEIVKPISRGEQNQLLYERWVKKREIETEKLSNGRIGYVHIRGMNDDSFREIYSEMLGTYYNKEAIIVDSRFNTGGWLHDELVTLLSGEKYITFSPRGNDKGSDPISKWTKKSIVLINECNYSDAHAFPFAYKTLGIGETVGMPIAGTMTAVWWETQIDQSIYFGIPQIAVKNNKGQIMENTQFEPDYKIANEYEIMIQGKDQQLEKAINVLLNQLD